MYSNYDPITNEWTTDSKYQEILKLDKMLIEADIPHTLRKLMDGWQICYPDTDRGDPYCIMDAIQHCGSYGREADLLEIMGLLTPEEEQHDSVLGHLTAENVFERIRKHYSGEWDDYIKSLTATVSEDKPLPYTRIDTTLNTRIAELMDDYHALLDKAKSYGLDIKLTPNSESSLELYFHDDYPDTLLVDKCEINM